MKVALVEKELFVSDQTLNEIYREAELFASQVGNSSEFMDKASTEGIQVRTANRVSKNDKRWGFTFWGRSPKPTT